MSEIKQHYLLEKYFVDNEYYIIVSEKCPKKIKFVKNRHLR